MRRMFCTSGRLYTLGHSGWIFLLRTLGTTMFFSCSETNVLAVCGKDNEGKVSCHFLDLGHDLASPKRQSTIQLAIQDNTVAINGEWRDMFLCLWTNVGHYFIIDYPNVRIPQTVFISPLETSMFKILRGRHQDNCMDNGFCRLSCPLGSAIGRPSRNPHSDDLAIVLFL